MKEQTVYVATVTEEKPCHGFEFSAHVFADSARAVAWVEGQIAALVAQHGLDRQTAVEDWLVRLDGLRHTIQYDIKEQPVL